MHCRLPVTSCAMCGCSSCDVQQVQLLCQAHDGLSHELTIASSLLLCSVTPDSRDTELLLMLLTFYAGAFGSSTGPGKALTSARCLLSWHAAEACTAEMLAAVRGLAQQG